MPPCGPQGRPRDRTSTPAAQANALTHHHPDCSEGRRRLAVRSPRGHEQHARTTDATGREPRVLDLMGVVSSLCTIPAGRTRRWATGRRASSESRWQATPPTKRSALGIDRMAAQWPRRRLGQARQPRAARRRAQRLA